MTTSFDWESVQNTRLLHDELPGRLAPYALGAGEGEVHELGDWHVTTMARHIDTGGEFTLHRVALPGGSSSPFVSTTGHVFIHVVEGELGLWFEGAGHRLIGGDSASVPAGTPFALTGRAALNSFYLYATDDWLHRLATESGAASASHIFSRTPASVISDHFSAELAGGFGLTVHDLSRGSLAEADPADPRARISPSGLPAGAVPFVTRAGLGERYETFQQMNSYPIRSRNNGGKFFAMDTRGAKSPYIPLHFHQEHSENFLCLGGRVRLHANGEEVMLSPGDFLHAPAGTIHSFSLAAHNTHMLGLLTPPVFEPFFEYMNEPTEAIVHEEGGQPYFPAGGFAKAREELDLVVVGPPPQD